MIAETVFVASWVELICAMFAVVAGGWSILLWRRDVKNRCADVYAQLLATYTSVEVFHAFEKWIDKDEIHGVTFETKSASCETWPEEVDRFLVFLNQVCYLRENKMIGEVELQTFRYALVRTLSNETVLKYLESLRQACSGEFMFESLMNFAATVNSPQTGDGKSPLTEEKWRGYLVDHFGGWTKTAVSVASRASTVCEEMGKSLDGLVATLDVAKQNLSSVRDAFANKSPAQISSYRNAVRHCCMAKCGVWLKDGKES